MEGIEQRIKELEATLEQLQRQRGQFLQQRSQLDSMLLDVNTRMVSIQGGIAELQRLLESKEPGLN